MQKTFFLMTTLLAFLAGGVFAQGGRPVRHVVVVTIDGSRPDFYLDSSWHAVHLRELAASGTYARGVNSVFPSMTYPSHTTIVTGVQPAKHGVYYNTGPQGIYWNDSSIRSPTLWQAAEDKGMVVASLFWPVSAEAPVQYNIPDIGSLGEAVREKHSKPAGLIDTLRAEVFGGASKIEYGRDVNVAKIAAYVIAKARPNLMTIHLFSVDHNEHMEGREGPGVRAAVRGADSAVGIIMDALKTAGIWDSTVLIVTGDHGFMTVHTQVDPNVWLAKAGLITDLKQGDWKAMFFSVGGSSYLYVKDATALASVERILRELPDSVKHYMRVIDRKQLDKIGGNPGVALALSGLNGAGFGNATSGEAVRPAHGGQHGYFPDFYEIRTGFVIHGPGVRVGGVIPEMNERDIAPIVARLMGIPFPSAQGSIPEGVLAK